MKRFETETEERLGASTGAPAKMMTGLCARARGRIVKTYCKMRVKAKETAGQGTTEYAILVGVLVVLAIVAITLFRPKLEELWTAIADGINGL